LRGHVKGGGAQKVYQNRERPATDIMKGDWDMASDQLIQAGLALAVIASPIIVIYMNNRSMANSKLAEALAAQKAREQDWEREDIVAAKAEAAAARNASLIAESSQLSAERSRILEGKVDVVHTLVNSTLTASMQVALDGMRREQILMEAAKPRDETAIELIKIKINELQLIINERNKQTGVADLQKQRVDAATAAEVVKSINPGEPALNLPIVEKPQPPLPPVTLGPVTQRVLEGLPVVFQHVSETAAKETLGIIDAAKDTVKAAEKTVVEVLKKPNP